METSHRLAAWDKMLPTQPYNSGQFIDRGSLERRIYDTIVEVSALKNSRECFALETTEKFTIEEMASTAVSLGFLQWLITLTNTKRVIEVGTFIGVSALHFASALPLDGRVVTIEKFDHFAEIARRNFASNGFGDKITLMLGDAAEVIPRLPPNEPFDFAFIDGNKERYADYLRMLAPRLRSGGVMVVDDALFHGDALNSPPRTAKGAGVRAALEFVRGLEWRRILLPIANGMLLLIKP